MYMSEEGLFRYKGNPIITPKDFPHEPALATFNCGQTMYKGKTILLVAVRLKRDSFPRMYVAESEDGIHFTFHDKPLITRSKDPLIRDLDEWPIDPRVTYIPEDDMYYIIRPVNSEWGTVAVLGRTKDFETYEELGITALPDNRVPCLFPEKINGKYVRLERPRDRIWISYSPDLIHWGEYKPLLKGYTTSWNRDKIGPTPPVKTKDGWLEIIHGVMADGSGGRYSIGAVLLDLDDPSKVIGKTMSPLITPDELYEYIGMVNLAAVFTCGCIADEEKDELRIYYGAADTCIGLASGKLSEVIRMCKENL